jgi:hypothetical protein
LRLDLHVDGTSRPDMVFLGTKRIHPPKLPADLTLHDDTSNPVLNQPFRAEQPGFYVFHHRGRGGSRFGTLGGTLDEQTLQQLRSLGYLR